MGKPVDDEKRRTGDLVLGRLEIEVDVLVIAAEGRAGDP
jgi:hypothetical protein